MSNESETFATYPEPSDDRQRAAAFAVQKKAHELHYVMPLGDAATIAYAALTARIDRA